MPMGSVATGRGWLRDEFGPDADIERIRLQEQFFGGRIDQALKLDWMLPNDEFDRAVLGGLRQIFPELTDDARLLGYDATVIEAGCRGILMRAVSIAD